jgi:hypothetical protein|tara:strand:- start:2832 stop:3569 length:738 start_codon:yes stop_codon:yes gene_type:complete
MMSGKLADMRYMVGFENCQQRFAQGVQADGGRRMGNQGWHWTHYMQDLNSLFPAFSASLSLPGKRDGHAWPKEAIELADSLLRLDHLAGLGRRGIEIEATDSRRDPRLKKLVPSSDQHSLFGGEAWMTASGSPLSDRSINWVQDDTRGVMGVGFGLGRLRAATEANRYPQIFDDASFTSLADRYKGSREELREAGKKRILLVVTSTNPTSKREQRFLIHLRARCWSATRAIRMANSSPAASSVTG